MKIFLAARGLILAAILLSVGCAGFLESARSYSNGADIPQESNGATGGTWAGRGFVADEDYGASRHGRKPAIATPWSGDDSQSGGDENGSAPVTEQEQKMAFSTKGALGHSVVQHFKNGSRATRADFIDESTNEGSLWASDGQTNYYFTKNKIRGLGEIVSVNLEQEIFKDTVQEVVKTLTKEEQDFELEVAQKSLRAKAHGLVDTKTGAKKDSVSTSAAAPARKPASPTGEEEDSDQKEEPAPEIVVPDATVADIDLTSVVELKVGDVALAEIVDRYSNGNYKINGSKKFRYRGNPRMLRFVAVISGTDISEEGVINSGKLYEYHAEVLR